MIIKFWRPIPSTVDLFFEVLISVPTLGKSEWCEKVQPTMKCSRYLASHIFLHSGPRMCNQQCDFTRDTMLLFLKTILSTSQLVYQWIMFLAAVKLNAALPFSLFTQKTGGLPMFEYWKHKIVDFTLKCIRWINWVTPLGEPVLGEQESPQALISTCLHVSTAWKKPQRTFEASFLGDVAHDRFSWVDC